MTHLLPVFDFISLSISISQALLSPRTELIPPALCPNSDRCHQVANLAGGLEHCCERCFRTNAVEHSGDCRWWRTSMEPWPSLETTLNDITPAPMDF